MADPTPNYDNDTNLELRDENDNLITSFLAFVYTADAAGEKTKSKF